MRYMERWFEDVFGPELEGTVAWGRRHRLLVLSVIIAGAVVLVYVRLLPLFSAVGRFLGPTFLLWLTVVSGAALIVLACHQGRQLAAALILLVSVLIGAYSVTRTLWAASLPLALVVATWLLARYERTVLIFSGNGIGDFSKSRTGSGTPAVLCDPLFPDWIRLEGADWVWIKNHPTDQEAQEGQTVWHRVPLNTPRFPWKVRDATLYFVVDDFANVFVNEALVRRREKGGVVIALDVANTVHPGENLIEMEIENAPMQGATWDRNLAGITFVIRMRLGLF